MLKSLFYAGGASLLFTVCIVSSAQAADKQFCATYAQTAVDQYQEAVKSADCQHFIQENPLRWQPYYENHYKGCMLLGRTASESQQEIRRSALASCAPAN